MATFTLHKDRLVDCPFDKNHKIAVRNQIKHIIECEQKMTTRFSVCIYNASHRMARHEFAKHIKNCPDGRQYTREVYYSSSQTDNKTEAEFQTKDSTDSQVISNAETTQEVIKDEEYDDWDNDNCPQYSIYDTKNVTETKDNSNQNTTTKLTKNQKKRNRRKAAIASQPIHSIWD